MVVLDDTGTLSVPWALRSLDNLFCIPEQFFFLPQPLYHQPTDTEVYMANKRQYAGFKRRLMEYFKKRHASKNERESHLTQTYSKLMTEWLKRVEKVCVFVC